MGITAGTQPTLSTGTVPAAIAVQGSSSFEQIIGYRSKLASFAGNLFRSLTDYLDAAAVYGSSQKRWNTNDEFTYEEYTAPNQAIRHINESTAEERILEMTDAIAGQTDSIVNSLLNVGAATLANLGTFNVDIQDIVTAITTILEKEIGSDPNSIYSLRDLVRIFVTTSVTNQSMQVLISDEDLDIIDTYIDSKIAAAQLRFDDDSIKFDRRSLNTLVNKGSIHSTVAAEALARFAIKKGNRAWETIEKEAISMKLEAIEKLWTIKVERARARIMAYDLLPVELPAGIASALGSIIDRTFIDPRSFMVAFPEMIRAGMEGLIEVRRFHQKDRNDKSESAYYIDQTNRAFLDLIITNGKELASSIGKMATFEAS